MVQRSLAEVLCGAAARWVGHEVDCGGGPAAPECERALRWRALSLELPADLIAAALAVRAGTPPVDRGSVLSPLLREVLGEGALAETHVHLGAAVRFEALWTGLVASTATERVMLRPSAKDSSHPALWAPFAGGEPFDRVLLSACLMRLALTRFLHRQSGEFDAEWRKIRVHWSRVLEPTLGPLGASTVDDASETLRRPLRVHAPGRHREWAARLRRAYRRLSGPGRGVSNLDEFERSDPASVLFGAQQGLSAELRLLTAGVRYALEVPGDLSFANAFWQYVRIRGCLFRWLVQRPGVGGLDWFVRGFERGRPLRRGTKPVELALALDGVAPESRLSSLEVRVAAESSAAKVRGEVRRLARTALRLEAWKSPEGGTRFGVLFHVIKKGRVADGLGIGGQLSVGDPREPAHGCRYGALAYGYQRQLGAVVTALRREPELLVVLRGLDVAGLELEVPTWVIAPLIEAVRRASRQATMALARRSGVALRPLCASYHAGEEFMDVLGGLRRIHELLEARALHDGDRIGHGLALGVAPRIADAGGALAYQRREDRLDDLLWLIDRVVGGDVACGAGLLARLSEEAMAHARIVYGPSLSGAGLESFRTQRRDRYRVYSYGYPWLRGRGLAGHAGDGLLAAYLCDPGVHERGSVPVRHEPSSEEVALALDVQKWLVGELARREVTIEACPSSNVIVGMLGSFAEHPMFALRPVHGGGSLAVSVNTDDPLVFATSLSEEYAYLYATLRRNGTDTATALGWLVERRRDGYRSRFTLDESRERRWLERVGGVERQDRNQSS